MSEMNYEQHQFQGEINLQNIFFSKLETLYLKWTFEQGQRLIHMSLSGASEPTVVVE